MHNETSTFGSSLISVPLLVKMIMMGRSQSVSEDRREQHREDSPALDDDAEELVIVINSSDSMKSIIVINERFGM